MRFYHRIQFRVLTGQFLVLIIVSSLIILFTTSRAKKVLVDHEFVDLFDETQLRCRMIASEIQGVRDLALRLANQPAVRRLLHDEKRNGPTWESRVENARREFRLALASASARNDLRIEWKKNGDLADESALVEQAAGITRFVIRQTDAESQIFQKRINNSSDNVCFSPVRKASFVENGVPHQSSYVLQTAVVGRSDDGKRIDGALIVTLNFQQLLDNLNQSPRHLVFVTDERRRALLLPVFEMPDGVHPPAIREMNEQERKNPALEFIDWLARDVPPSGDSLVPSPSFRVDSRYMPARKLAPGSVILPDDAWNPPKELQFSLLRVNIAPDLPSNEPLLAFLLEQAKADNALIIPGTLPARTEQFSIRHGDTESLKILRRKLRAHPEFGSFLTIPAIVECERFGRVLYQFALEPVTSENQSPPYLRIGMAVAREEIEADIQDQLGETLLFATGWAFLAVVAGFFYTRFRLGTMNRVRDSALLYAQGKTGPAKAILPTDATGEFGLLARSFDSMIDNVELQRTQLRDNERRIRSVLESASEAIITVDNIGRIWTFNNAANHLFQYTESEIKEKSIGRIVRSTTQGDIALETPSSESAEHTSVRFLLAVIDHIHKAEIHEGVGQRKDGTTFPIEYSGRPIDLADGTTVYTMAIRNIEDRKRRQEIEQQSRYDLEREVAKKTVELREAIEELKQVDQLKNVFLATVSHELRTPLNHIFLASQWLIKEDLPEVHKEELHIILDSARYLNALVKDLLDYMKMIDGKIELHPEEFDGNDFFQSLTDSMTSEITKRENRLDLQLSSNLGTLVLDRTRLRQVVTNLLHNAAKFTQRGRITLTARREVRPLGDVLIVRVSDTGLGIPKEKQDKLFQPFSKIHGRKENLEGTGLGLAICKQLCIRMGGGIEVESDTNKGAEFTVTIAVGTPKTGSHSLIEKVDSPSPTKPTEDSSAPTTSREVLIVDDDEKTRDGMRRTLQEMGFRVLTASSGIEALELVRRRPPAVVLLDVLMPTGFSGWSILAALKNNEETEDIPVVIVSVLDERQRAMKLGASGYIVKPIMDWERVSTLIRKYQSSGERLLLIEDDEKLRQRCAETLRSSGWTVNDVGTTDEALTQTSEPRPALILLDLDPLEDRLAFLERLRKVRTWRDCPIIAWSMRELSEEDRNRLDRLGVTHAIVLASYDEEGLLRMLRNEVHQSLNPEWNSGE